MHISSIFVASFVLCILIIVIISLFNNMRVKKADQQEREHAAKIFEQDREYYRSFIDRSPEELAGMPGDVEIGEDGLPKEIGSSKWGSKFTFYHTPTGYAYHKKQNCYPYGLIPVHAWSVANSNQIPCSKCNPVLPDLSWFSRYRDIIKTMNTYGISRIPYNGPSQDYLRAKKN